MQLSTITALLLPAAALAAPSLVPRQSAGWTVKSFTRNCTDPNICTYNFTVDTGNSTQPCTTVDVASPATTHPWFGVSCQQTPDYQISWGWDYNQNFTVLTVLNVPTQLRAYFGYSHPNAGLPVATYPDVGPNAVQRP